MAARTAKTYPQVFTLGEFRNWFITASPGEGTIYYTGHLMCDRQGADSQSSYLDTMAKEVYAHAQRGEIHLLQNRIGDHHYEYRAIRTSPRNMALMLKLLRRPSSVKEVEYGTFRETAKLVDEEHACLLQSAS